MQKLLFFSKKHLVLFTFLFLTISCLVTHFVFQPLVSFLISCFLFVNQIFFLINCIRIKAIPLLYKGRIPRLVTHTIFSNLILNKNSVLASLIQFYFLLVASVINLYLRVFHPLEWRLPMGDCDKFVSYQSLQFLSCFQFLFVV